MTALLHTPLNQWPLENGKRQDLNLYHQVFGLAVGTAPIVLVNHALTGNSEVSGTNGWWRALIGNNKVIDTNCFTVIAINVPGNGFDKQPQNLIGNYKDFTAKDIARLYWEVLAQIGIDKLFAVLGGSLGGGIAWEMAALKPKAIQHLIPIATDWKATDWIATNVLLQDRMLHHSKQPLQDARLHAMLLYRTPASLRLKFNRTQTNGSFDSEHWLLHHGTKLQERFSLASYKLMNHLLKTIAAAQDDDQLRELAQKFTGSIHLVGVDSDLFFVPDETRETYQLLRSLHHDIQYHEIKSLHGHDAFLIEYEQLESILKPIFNNCKQLQHATSN